MKTIALIFSFQFLFFYTYSQNTFSITGILKCDSIFVKNATVKLFKDSVPVQATTTDANGFFVFEKVVAGQYSVKIISLFYEPVAIDVNLINNKDIGTIELSETAVFLNEVVIQKKVEPIIITNDGVILNVANSILSNKGSALDLLNYAPVTFISASDSQFESDGLDILINGKPVNISADKQDMFLKSISSQNIEKIEIIDKPDASVAGNKYGKINIILNKNKGFSGNLAAKLNYYKNFHQEYPVSLFYNSDKITLYSMFNMKICKYLTEENGTENRNGLIINKRNNEILDNKTPDFIFGADYKINNKSSLGLLYSMYFERINFNNSNKYIFSADYLENDSLIYKKSDNISKYFSQTITLSYSIKTDSLGSNFSTSVDYAPTKYNQKLFDNFSFWKSLNDTIPVQIIDYKYEMPYKNDVLSYNIRYDHNFNNSSSLNLGSKLSYTNYNNGWNAFNLINEDYIFDETGSKKITFNEYIVALFTGYNFKYKKSSFSISIRGEYNHNKYKNNDDNYSSTDSWTILPSFRHSISINKSNRIYYYFTKKIYRPNFRYYMENSRYDPISQSYGNSKLKPQNQYVFAIGYVLKNKYSVTLQALRNDNLFLNLPEISENKLIYKIMNGGLAHSVGISLNLPIEFFEWWETSNNISSGFVNRNFKDKNYFSNSFRGSFSHSSTFYLPKKIYFSIDYSYNSRTQSFFVEQADVHNLGVGAGWRVNDDFSIHFSVSDILNSVSTNTKYNYYEIITGNSTNKQIMSRTFWIGIFYSFSVGKKIENKNVRESGIEEQKERIH